MYHFLDVLVFAYPALMCLYSWHRWLREPEAVEARDYERLSTTPFRWMTAGGTTLLRTAAVCLYAAWRAKLWWLWAIFAAITCFFGLLTVGSAAHASHNKMVPPVGPPLTPERLERRVARGRRRIWIQAGFLLLWIYSWQHLFLDE
ncbi:MAG TPA: hypothetical protein VGB92_22790 [Longimicrobium sp.]|jgi:hypothetical protein